MKKIILAFMGFFFISTAFAAAQIKEGVDYTVIPQDTSNTKMRLSKTVNVKEFFSFTCIHCKDVEPLIENLVARDKKIALEKIHIVWNNDATIMSFAKLNATFQVLKLNRLYIPTFDAIFNRQNINDPEILKSFLKTNGLSNEQIAKFMTMYNSFDISTIVAKYKNMTADPRYNITGTPTFVVADKYIVSPALPGRLAEVIEALVAKVPTKQ